MKYTPVVALLGSASGDADRIAFFDKHPGYRSKADCLRAALDAIRQKKTITPDILMDIKTELLALRQQVATLQQQLLEHGVHVTPQAPYADGVDLSVLDGVFT